MNKSENPRQYDLEDRTYLFAKNVSFCEKTSKLTFNIFGAIIQKSKIKTSCFISDFDIRISDYN